MTPLAIVYGWIAEAHGVQAAHDWAWACTPFPFGPPTSDMLEDGLRLAAGEVSLEELIVAADEQMEADYRAWKASQPAEATP